MFNRGILLPRIQGRRSEFRDDTLRRRKFIRLITL